VHKLTKGDIICSKGEEVHSVVEGVWHIQDSQDQILALT